MTPLNSPMASLRAYLHACACFCQDFRYRAAKAADHRVLFHGNHLTCLFRGSDDQFLIKRFDRMDIDYFRLDTLGRQFLGRCQRF